MDQITQSCVCYDGYEHINETDTCIACTNTNCLQNTTKIIIQGSGISAQSIQVMSSLFMLLKDAFKLQLNPGVWVGFNFLQLTKVSLVMFMNNEVISNFLTKQTEIFTADFDIYG